MNKLKTLKHTIFFIFLLNNVKVSAGLINNSDFGFAGHSYKKYAVVGSTKEATKIGQNIILKGGNAMDAVLAMQAAVAVTESHASGFGGGGYILYFDSKSGILSTFDGREIASAKSTKNNIFNDEYKNSTFPDFYSARYIAVPAMPKLMKLAHSSEGRLPWRDIFTPAIMLAENGFVAEPRLKGFVKKYKDILPFINADIENKKPNLFINKKLARTMKMLSTYKGVEEFYHGKMSSEIANAVRKEGGFVDGKDFATYNAYKKDGLCMKYKNYKICTRDANFTPLIAIKLLEKVDFSKYNDSHDPNLILLISNAINAAIANKAYYDGDGFYDSAKLLSSISNNTYNIFNVQKTYAPNGVLKNEKFSISENKQGTTAFFAIDKDGNVAIFTSSINAYFGSGVAVAGMPLNNTLIDFSECSDCMNRVRPLRRPASSMSPIMVFDSKNKPIIGLSSAGGLKIISYVVSTLMDILEFNTSPQEAINKPKYALNNTKDIYFEPDRISRFHKTKLTNMGFNVVETDEVISGLVAFKIDKDGLIHSGFEVRRWFSSLGG